MFALDGRRDLSYSYARPHDPSRGPSSPDPVLPMNALLRRLVSLERPPSIIWKGPWGGGLQSFAWHSASTLRGR